MNWLNEKILNDDDIGFVYIIINLNNNKFYIGKKFLKFTRKTKISKKEKLLTKTKKIYKEKIYESDWKTYTGSNDELNEDIKKGDTITKYILKGCKTKKELTYYEVKYQFEYDVLNSKSYNKNILGKFFRKDIN